MSNTRLRDLEWKESINSNRWGHRNNITSKDNWAPGILRDDDYIVQDKNLFRRYVNRLYFYMRKKIGYDD